MIQTTLFNYFACNEPFKQAVYKPTTSLKQNNLTHYFKTIPKKKNLILNYFTSKGKEKEKEKKKVLDLVLVDIKESWETEHIKCVKKNMYDSDLKYVVISYRWGEVEEQLLKTPDYTARITSFYLYHLAKLCKYINHEPDLKNIPYLWIDTISVDQQNQKRKKDTILKMSQIYEMATYVLAVPDMHYRYLCDNTANQDVFKLILENGDKIFLDIYNTIYSSTIPNNNIEDLRYNSIEHTDNNYSAIQRLIYKNLKKEINEIESRKSKKLTKVYRFLAYLIKDWSNRVWVISEYQIAKQKYKQNGTPLKYIFISILFGANIISNIPFFSYNFVDKNNKNSNMKDSMYQLCDVDNSSKLIDFLELVLTKRSHVDMMIKSMASKDEDRFYAILPSWNKYNHLIKNRNTISNWKITGLLSAKLKLYEILHSDDLWNKARLLYYCSISVGKPILPSFATYHDSYLILSEIDYVDNAQKELVEGMSVKYVEDEEGEEDIEYERYTKYKEYIEDYKKKHGTIFRQNLIDIQYHLQQCTLSVKASNYFLFDTPLSSIGLSKEDLSDYLLQDNDSLRLVYIPYFTYDIPEFRDIFPLDEDSIPNLSGTLLLGNYDTNRWILVEYGECKKFGKPKLCSIEDDYVFNIH
ncbi:unnamed protein product [Cunninghamella blakesleeana]